MDDPSKKAQEEWAALVAEMLSDDIKPLFDARGNFVPSPEPKVRELPRPEVPPVSEAASRVRRAIISGAIDRRLAQKLGCKPEELDQVLAFREPPKGPVQ